MGQASVDAIQEWRCRPATMLRNTGTAGAIIQPDHEVPGPISFTAASMIMRPTMSSNAAQPYTDISVPTRRHDYGFTVGGPVILPKVYNGTNKSFFFMSFEEFYENVMVSAIPAASGGTPHRSHRCLSERHFHAVGSPGTPTIHSGSPPSIRPRHILHSELHRIPWAIPISDLEQSSILKTFKR
jgi:hypothetical protein